MRHGEKPELGRAFTEQFNLQLSPIGRNGVAAMFQPFQMISSRRGWEEGRGNERLAVET